MHYCKQGHKSKVFTLIKKAVFGDKRIIPVVMFHSVGLNNTDWIYKHISEPLDLFEEKICKLKKAGFNFIFWDDLYQYMVGQKKIKTPAIMLTFDDGYLDNWVLAYPVLKKYGAKGTIFVNPEFVDKSNNLRKNLDNVWRGENSFDELNLPGFLNWNEMRAMEDSGVVDIQSHADSHTWYFCSDKLVDFYRPGLKKYPWLAWNIKPEKKTRYMFENQEYIVPYGYPIYQFEKSLICRRYFPPDKIIAGLVDYVTEHGGQTFFQRNSSIQEITEYHQSLMARYKGEEQFETSEEYHSRVVHELVHSKACIEQQLRKRVDYICWPGGGYNGEVLEAAKKVGYKAWTLSSRDNTNYRNVFLSATPEKIKRIGSFIRVGWRGKKFNKFGSSSYFINEVRRHQGCWGANASIKFYKLKNYILTT